MTMLLAIHHAQIMIPPGGELMTESSAIPIGSCHTHTATVRTTTRIVSTEASQRCVNSMSVLSCHAGSSEPWHKGHWSVVPQPLPLPVTRTMPPQMISRYVITAVHTARRRKPTDGREITVPPALRGRSRRGLLACDSLVAHFKSLFIVQDAIVQQIGFNRDHP